LAFAISVDLMLAGRRVIFWPKPGYGEDVAPRPAMLR